MVSQIILLQDVCASKSSCLNRLLSIRFEIAKAARKTGASIVVITSYPKAPLTTLADIVLTCTAEETTYRSEALTSRISQLAIIDAIFVLVMFKNKNESNQSLKKIRTIISDHKTLK